MRTAAAVGTRTRTRIALLGTLGELHAEPLRYDLARLRSLVETVHPDLLCVEADPQAWANGDLSGASVEVRESLVPAARHLDTVVVPLGAPSPLELTPPEEGGLAALRARMVGTIDALFTRLERAADSPERVSSALFGYACHLLCEVEAAVASDVGRRAWDATNAQLLDRLLWLARRDPGRRILVAVQCRRVHRLEAGLRALRDELLVVPYHEL